MATDTTGRAVDVLLGQYAAGMLAPPLHALVAAHLELKPDNRRFVTDLETLAGDMIARTAPVASVPDRDARLAAIFAMPQDASPAAPRRVTGDSVLPASLARFIGHDLNSITWRRKLPGVKEYRVFEGPDGEASLLWIRAGKPLPTHTHEGTEVTLVLKGGFSDGLGHYVRGDVAVADDSVDHRPIADDDGEDCVCFEVTEGRLRLTGPIGRVIQRFVRR